MNDVTIVLSNINDGSMSKGVNDQIRNESRRKFLAKHDMTLEKSVWARLKYEGEDYCRYLSVDNSFAGDGMSRNSTIVCDSIFTKEKGLSLFLPLADCVGAVLYDPANKVLGLAHLGRHNLAQVSGEKTVRYMQEVFGTKASGIKVHLSPAAGKQSYPLYDFDGAGLQETTIEQLIQAGVVRNNISVDARDTTIGPNLFSHSLFLKDRRSIDGRQALVVMLK